MDSEKTYYELLRCCRMSSTAQINVEFHILAKECHPDKCGNAPGSADRFATLQRAREVLTNDAQRTYYDAWLASGLDVTFSEYKAMRERGGWHWSEPRQQGQLTSTAAAANTAHTQTETHHSTSTTAAASSTSTGQQCAPTSARVPRFYGSSSRTDILQRFRNRELKP